MCCNQCGRPVREYANGKRCRDCYNGYMRDYMLRRYHERRDRAIALLGGACAECGGTADLEIDHIDWRAKEIDLARLWSIAEVKFLEELEGCQVLCGAHHHRKTVTDLAEQRVERPWPQLQRKGHGSQAEYGRGCRCGLCRQAKYDGRVRRGETPGTRGMRTLREAA